MTTPTKLRVIGLYDVMTFLSESHRECKALIVDCKCQIAIDWRQIEDTVFVLIRLEVHSK